MEQFDVVGESETRRTAAMSCPKCGQEVSPTWHQREDDEYFAKRSRNSACEAHGYNTDTRATLTLDEHLHYRCHCGYQWAGPPLDAA